MDRFAQRRLLRLMARHGIGEFLRSDADVEIALSLAGLTPLHPEIRAAQAGRFTRRHPASFGQPLFPRSVQAGEIVAYLTIGMLLIPVAATRDSILPPPLVSDEEIVGYGDVLF